MQMSRSNARDGVVEQAIIIVKLNFLQQNGLTAILNVFLADEKISLLYYFHGLCNQRHNKNSPCLKT